MKRPPEPKKRLARLLADAVPRPDQLSREPKTLAEFMRPKFGAKGMAVDLRYLSWQCAGRAVVAASKGDVTSAQSELSEAFRRLYWSTAVLQPRSGCANTLAVFVLEAFIRQSGLDTMKRVLVERLSQGDPHRHFLFAKWAAKLLEWDGNTELFSDSPYDEMPEPVTSQTPADRVVPALCAWHLQMALREGGFTPFYFTPYTVLPVEVFAWLKRRTQLGLPNPAVDHPLLTTAIALVPLPPVELAPKGHELIEPLLARCLKEGVLGPDQVAELTGGT